MTDMKTIMEMTPEELDIYNKKMLKRSIIRTAVMVGAAVVIHVGVDILLRKLPDADKND